MELEDKVYQPTIIANTYMNKYVNVQESLIYKDDKLYWFLYF